MARQNEGEVAIVTGGTRGIGAAIALALAERGVRLVVNGRDTDATVEETVAGLKAVADTELVLGDASDPAVAAALVEAARARFGRIDYLVPAAGGPAYGTVMDHTPESWEAAFRIHIHAVFHLFRAAHPLLKVRGGSMLMIGSVAGIRGVRARRSMRR
jgi:NAD(P)-dependent dehydrogenase (short-subunit alcohol dehydrogenase family)